MRTAIVDIIPRNEITPHSTASEIILASGNNTGNVVWVDSIQEQICHESLIPVGEIKGESDIRYVFPIANAIRANDTTLEYLYDLLGNYSLNVIPIGLGAQLSRAYPTPKMLVSALSEKQIKCLRYFSRNSETMAVRGSITAECLDRLGIHNYRIIGCPSFFEYGSEGFPAPKKPSTDKIVFNLNGRGKPDEYRLLNLLSDKSKLPALPSLAVQTKNELSFLEGGDFIKNNSAVFSSRKDWSHWLKEQAYTFSVGGRFHGNMISLLSGIPALWLVHDSRTRELAETLALPRLPVERLYRIREIEDLLAHCRYSEEFYSNYHKVFDEYRSFLKENDLAVTPRLPDPSNRT